MPSIGSLPLTDLDDGFESGAAFLLVSPPEITKRVKIGSDVELGLEKSNPYLVVRLRQPGSEAKTFKNGLILAQQGLDLLSIKGVADLATRNVETEHICWWKDGEGTALYIFDTVTSEWDVNIKISTEAKEAQRPATTYHASYRYFRLAQVSEELFDAYRNMYLAFELILSSIDPPRNENGRESERHWIERVLRSLGRDIIPPSIRSKSDPIQEISETVYGSGRNPLFHAKAGRDFTPPSAEVSDREEVQDRLRLLTELYLRLAKHQYGPNRGMGPQFFQATFRKAFQQLLLNARFVASDYDGPHDESESDLKHPRFSSGLKIPALRCDTKAKDALTSIRGESRIDQSSTLSGINRIDLVDNEKPLAATMLESTITTAGLKRLVCHFDLRHVSAKTPKTKFAL